VRFQRTLPRAASIAAALAFATATASAADQPQWGVAWTRNQVSPERHLAATFAPATGTNIRWTFRLGTESYSTPVVAHGAVLVGGNNNEPHDPRHAGDRGVLYCIDEKTGKLRWQLVVPKREEDPYFDWPNAGLASTATVEDRRVYVVSNRGEVMCLDLDGMANGNDGPFLDEARHQSPASKPPVPTGPLDADILWLTDLTREAGIWSHDGAHSSILVHGNHLYLNSGTGVDNTHKKIRTPDAPSLLVLDKRTGKILARDREHIAPNIFHCTWSSPSLARVAGHDQILFAGGNGILYGFEPIARNAAPPAEGQPFPAIRKLWEFDFDPGAPKEDVHRYNSNRATSPSNIYGMPVVVGTRVYVTGGGDWFWGKNEAWVKCVALGGTGDVTQSGLRWSHPVGRHIMSTPAVADGLVYVADSMHVLHCLDAATGATVWTQELKGEVWASALVADGKVYIGTRRGDHWVLAAGREKKVLNQIDLDGPVSATAIAANGSLYFATMKTLYAVAPDRAP